MHCLFHTLAVANTAVHTVARIEFTMRARVLPFAGALASTTVGARTMGTTRIIKAHVDLVTLLAHPPTGAVAYVSSRSRIGGVAATIDATFHLIAHVNHAFGTCTFHTKVLLHVRRTTTWPGHTLPQSHNV
jgi:hypothetical protein